MAPRERGPQRGFAHRVLGVVVALPDHAWLDRVVRGRVWIPLLGILLAGIVAAQVEILKLGASMGQALEQTSTLTTQNEALRGSVAGLADDQRIERLAGGLGMVLPPPGAVGYLVAGPGGNLSGALGNIHTPDPAAFVGMTAKNGALITGPGTSTLPPAPGAPAPPPAATTPSTATASAGSSTGATSTVITTPTTTSSTTGGASSTTPGVVTSQQSTSTPSQTPTQQTPTQQTPATSSSSASPATGAAAIQPPSSNQSTGG